MNTYKINEKEYDAQVTEYYKNAFSGKSQKCDCCGKEHREVTTLCNLCVLGIND